VSVFQDAFTRTAALDGSTSSDSSFTWAYLDGAANFANTTGTLLQTDSSGSETNATYGTSASCTGDAMYVKVTLVSAVTLANTAFWLDIRQNGVYPSGHGYELLVQPTLVTLFKINAGAFNTLATQAFTLAAGDTIEFGWDGANLYVKQNGTTIKSFADSSEPTGAGNRKAAFGMDGTGTASPGFRYDNFEYGDIGGASDILMGAILT
jgi:hypothetical protein